MCKYYGYARVSTETQAEKGFGLEAQEQAIRKYAKDNGIELTNIFKDEGISANIHDDADDDALLKRQALMELLSDVEAGDTIIVLNTSRLWRSDMTKVLVRRELMKHQAKIISIEQPRYDLYSKDPNEFFINSMMELIDIYDRMNIALKLARGRSVKAHKGNKPAGICPYGYQYSDDKKSVIINEEQAQTVKFIFSEAQKGRSMQSIADALNEQGIPSRFAGMTKKTRDGQEVSFSGKWNRGAIHAIAHNRFYIGELEHDGQTIQGKHEPIISKVQFGKVQAALSKRHK